MVKFNSVLALLAIVGMTATIPAWSATKDVKTVVGQVGAEWNDEALLRKFHEDLSKRFKDAPAFEGLTGDDRWYAVLDLAEAKRAKSLAARAGGVGAVAKGDIVEVSYTDPTKAASYSELPRIVKVVCKSGTQNFAECKASTRLGAFNSEGAQTSWGD